MNYYNEIDPKAAAWLRELMADGLIPKGEVDERSITEVKPTDLVGFTQCHFFAGISGWSLALRLAVWPEDRPVWSGSCPCQPFSCAGKGEGVKDERHLWPAFFGLIKECKPPTIFGEQVASSEVVGNELEAAFVDAVQRCDYARANKLAHQLARSSSLHFTRRWLDGIQDDLEGAGYLFGSPDLPAASVGAPHIRQRLYWVAHAASGRSWDDTNTERQPCEGRDNPRMRGSVSRLADTELRRSEQRDESEQGVQQLDADSTNSGVGDLQQSGLEGYTRDGDDRNEPGRNSTDAPRSTAETGATNFWSDAIWHQCRDGKSRRIPNPESRVLRLVDGLPDGMDFGWLQSGFPLAATKIPGRVALLKGYGNAIVAELASEVVRAYLEIEKQFSS